MFINIYALLVLIHPNNIQTKRDDLSDFMRKCLKKIG